MTGWHYVLIETINKLKVSMRNDREAFILQKKILEGYTLKYVGQQLGVTSERIRQIEHRILRKIRHPSRRKWFLKEPHEDFLTLSRRVPYWK